MAQNELIQTVLDEIACEIGVGDLQCDVRLSRNRDTVSLRPYDSRSLAPLAGNYPSMDSAASFASKHTADEHRQHTAQ